MKKSKIITIVILASVVLLTGIFFLIGNKNIVLSPVNNINTINPANQIVNNPKTDLNSLNIPAGDSRILGNREDLIAFSIPAGDFVNMETEVTGAVKGGYFFEGNIIINILDKDKKLLRSGHGTATTDWMTSGPVSFKATIDFNKLGVVDQVGNYYGGPAYIEIHNDNASGLPENDKSILIPVVVL